MYKTKLQELCQKRSWSLPEYSTTKQGLDHNPSFSATVVVNDQSFHTLAFSKSSREAQNDAAKLAFDYFSLPNPSPNPDSKPPIPIPPSSSFPQPSLLSPSPGSVAIAETGGIYGNRQTLQQQNQETHQTPQPGHNTSILQGDNTFKDAQRLNKSELLIYAQKRNLAFPVYSCEREGPPHASRFKCRVTIDGKTYESPEYFSTLKEAEHAAAKVALISLAPDSVQKDDSTFYKNLLQQLVQKEGLNLPLYYTNRSGETHSAVFISTVEIEGEPFTGEEAKTKKQAEMNAAKVAYNALKERRSSQIPLILSSSLQGQEASELLSSHVQSNTSASLQHHVRPNAPMQQVKDRTALSPPRPSLNQDELACIEAAFKVPEMFRWYNVLATGINHFLAGLSNLAVPLSTILEGEEEVSGQTSQQQASIIDLGNDEEMVSKYKGLKRVGGGSSQEIEKDQSKKQRTETSMSKKRLPPIKIKVNSSAKGGKDDARPPQFMLLPSAPTLATQKASKGKQVQQASTMLPDDLEAAISRYPSWMSSMMDTIRENYNKSEWFKMQGKASLEQNKYLIGVGMRALMASMASYHLHATTQFQKDRLDNMIADLEGKLATKEAKTKKYRLQELEDLLVVETKKVESLKAKVNQLIEAEKKREAELEQELIKVREAVVKQFKIYLEMDEIIENSFNEGVDAVVKKFKEKFPDLDLRFLEHGEDEEAVTPVTDIADAGAVGGGDQAEGGVA